MAPESRPLGKLVSRDTIQVLLQVGVTIAVQIAVPVGRIVRVKTIGCFKSIRHAIKSEVRLGGARGQGRIAANLGRAVDDEAGLRFGRWK